MGCILSIFANMADIGSFLLNLWSWAKKDGLLRHKPVNWRVVTKILLFAGPLAILILMGLVPSVWWSQIGQILTWAKFIIIFLCACIPFFVLYWILHYFNTPYHDHSKARRSLLQLAVCVAVVVLMVVVFSDHLKIWLNKWTKGIETIALINDAGDAGESLANVCSDLNLTRFTSVRFICPDSQQPSFYFGDKQPLQWYVENMQLAGAMSFSNTHSSGLAFTVTTVPPMKDMWKLEPVLESELAIPMRVLEYVSLLACNQQDYKTVLELSDQLHNRHLPYWPPRDYPAFLRCYIEAAYDSYEGLALDPYIADLIRAMSEALERQQSQNGHDAERALNTLAYVRLMLRSGEYEDAEKLLLDLQRDMRIDENADNKLHIHATLDRLLGETYLAQYQFEPGASPDKLDSAARQFSQALEISDSASAHYGLGRAYFVRNYFENEDDRSKRTTEPANKSHLLNAINELERAANSGGAACLEHNARLWLGAAYALAGSTEQSERMANSVKNTIGCDFGLNIETPVLVTENTIAVTVGLPRPSTNYVVMIPNYGIDTVSAPLVPVEQDSPIHRAELHLEGPPRHPPRFVYYSSDQKAHLALQKAVQLGIKRADEVRAFDVFPVVMSSDAQVTVTITSPHPDNIVRSGDNVTVTAQIVAQWLDTHQIITLTDKEILNKLEVCINSDQDAPCNQSEVMQGPDGQGIFHAQFRIDGPKEQVFVVNVNNKDTDATIRSSSTQVAVMSRPDTRKYRVGVTNASFLRAVPDAKDGSGRLLDPHCSLVRIDESSYSHKDWYRVYYYVADPGDDGDGFLTIPGYVSTESILVQREMIGDQLSRLALTKNRTSVDLESGVPAYSINRCTLVEVLQEIQTVGDQPHTRFRVNIYDTSSYDPTEGWMNDTDLRRTPLGTR